jgi:phosphoribosylanthranilate isomerase
LHCIPRRGAGLHCQRGFRVGPGLLDASGPGVIPAGSIPEIARRIPPPIATFLLTSATASEALITRQRRYGTNTLQLCDYPEVSVYRELRRDLPGVAAVQVIHVTGPEGLDRAREAAEHVHSLLLIHKRGALT